MSTWAFASPPPMPLPAGFGGGFSVGSAAEPCQVGAFELDALVREMFPPGSRSSPFLTDEQKLAVYNRAIRLAKAESPEARQARRAAERKAATRQKLAKARASSRSN